MKKIFTLLFTLISFLGYSQSSTLVISQVYGAGGNAGALYSADYVELHNISTSTINLDGVSVQYGSAATTNTWTGFAALPAIDIPAGGYYLIQMSAVGINGAALPTPDFVASPAIAMAAANGKVALVMGLDTVSNCTATSIIDVVGYGTANCGEGTTTAPLSATTAALRNNNGCTDTNDNSLDFTVDAPAPRNSATAAQSCAVTTDPAITASTLVDFGTVAVGENSTSQTLTISGSNLTGAPGNITVNAPAGFEVSLDGTTWSSSLDIPFTSETLASTNIFVRFTPPAEGAFTGDIVISGGGLTSAVTVAVSGNGGTVTPPDPTITGSTLVDFGTVTVGANSNTQTLTISGSNLTGAPGNITVNAPAGFEVSLDGTTWSSSLDVPYTSETLSSTNIFVRFTPSAEGAFTGNIVINGGGLTSAVNIAVSGNGGSSTPPVTAGLVISQAFGSGGQVGSPFTADFVELHNNTTASIDLTGLSIQYGSAASSTWSGVSPLPAASIPAGGYYLIQMSVTGSAGDSPLPTPDYVATPPISMAGANGKVAIVNGTTAIASCTESTIIDLLGYGTANCGETTPTAALSLTTAAWRNNNGCTDTDDNVADFTIQTPAPRNSASALVSCSSATTPTITASTLVDFGNVTVGTSSASQTLTISGTDLTGAPGNIEVGVPAGFEVSLDGTTWSTVVNIPYTSETLSSTNIFVRFTPTAAGTFTGVGYISGGGVVNPIDLSVSGTGVTTPADPAITTSTTITDFGTVTVGSSSASQTLIISGTNLTGAPGDITVNAPAGFEVSLDGTTWSASVTVPYTSETLSSTNIFVRFTPPSEGAFAGDIIIRGGGLTTSVTVAVSGNGATSTPVTSGLVISQAYGAGGNAGAVFNADYVEIKNNTNSAISLSGLSIQYGSATSTTAWSGVSPLPAASIPAGGFYLIQMSAAGANGAALPTPDYVAVPPIGMAGSNGKVALVNGITAISSCTESTIIDLLGYGTANCGETTPSVPISATTAAMRIDNGCTDTDDNSADFTAETPAPRNSATAPVSCSTSTTPTITTSTLVDFGTIAVGSNSGSQTLTISGTNLTGAPGDITVNAPAGFEVSLDGTTWSASVTVPYTSETLSSTSIFVRFTPPSEGAFAGDIIISGGGLTTSVTVAVSGNGGTAGAPSITATTLAGFGEVCVGNTSDANSFTITGTDLTTTSVTVSGVLGYTLSTSENGTYTPSLDIPQSGGSFTQIVYVKLTPTAIQPFNGNFGINGGGTTATVNVAVTGAGANSTPSVITGDATSITNNSATLGGSLTSAGCSAITTYGIAYSNTSGFTTGTEVVSTNIASNLFSSDVNGLAASTTYYYKAFANNAAGISYGVEKSFTTTGGGGTPTSSLVISQLYGGGGNTGAQFNADYVEIHNGTNSPVSLDGMSVQYASATNTATWSAATALPAVTIPVGGYFLVQMSATGAVGVPLPTPDHIANPPIAMAGANGKVALVNGITPLISCIETNIIDLVGYGTANCAETTPTPALSNTTAGFRNQNGCVDTDNNLADFTVAAPAPRNSATPILSCGGPVPTLSASTLADFGTVIIGANSTSQTINLSGTLLTSFPGNITVTAPAGFEVSLDGTTWTSSVSIPFTSATLASTQVFVRFTPTVVGNASGNITISGGGANTTVAVLGTGGTTPADVTATSLEEFGVVCINEVGGPNSFTLTGTGLNTTPVVVGPLNGFTFSTTVAGTYASTLSIPQGGGALNQVVFVKFIPLAGTSYSGDIPVTGGGISGTINVAASGSGNSAGAALVTGDATNITYNSAFVTGQITENACSPASEYGIAVSGIQNFPAGVGRNFASTNIDAAGNFSAQLTGLVQNTIYYYKSYSINAGVITFGEEKTFTTLPIGSGLIVYSNPITRGNTMHFSISGVQPGHYSARFYNMLGQIVFQRDIILQVGYIDEYFVVPTTIPKGTYRFQVINQTYKGEKTILVL